ncbi:carboxymuconolactone decarboxylase family protein [Tahibacter soli]|uniref:Carboxymuconolactone decarboxylase family protein n=1 Tax=Tahibacter soli TaxID=2983605 RepID=A0A9X4BKI4_9GAMM|nr:carboxymuconolactone decarboxylase family protein [Tahibacter soli]MDC8013244.1 carboxymuconolactone decarboxylase family protein [Tahibacter soli]
MSYIPTVDRNRLDAVTNAALDGVKAKLGSVPNMFLTFAHTPVALNAYNQLAAVTSGGRLNAKQREQIALAVGEANDCTYCVAAHGAIGKLVGLNANQIDLARGAQADNPRDAAILELARRIVETRGHVPTAELDAFKAAGFGDADILEVLVNVVLNIYTNYTNHIARTDVDFPVVARQAA